MSFTARHFWINVFINIVCQRFRNIGIVIKYIITIIITVISIYYYYYNFLSWKKNYDYRNTWNLIKTTIIVIISKCGQGKTNVEYEAGKNLRARLHETRSELRPVWDFTSGKISLRCEVTSLSTFTWLRAEWNSLRLIWPKWFFKPQWVLHVNSK